jgi:ubiquinone/menaquinone biosynthesis C-methylase UbiE
MSAPKQPRWAGMAGQYEAWYQTSRGRKYDALEKGLMNRLLGPAQGRRLLEIGCGTGHFTRWLGRLGWKSWGVDREEGMIRYARDRSDEDLLFCRADAQALPFRDRSFDVCVMITTLESTRVPELALREALRVSREMVLLGVLNTLSLLALWRRVRAVFRPTIFSQTRFYSAPALRGMISKVARQSGMAVRLRMASRWGGRLPLGAFYALAVEMKRSG